MTDEIKVGTTLYEFDNNRRVYDKEKGGGPIYREHFRPIEVVGETAKSWLVSGYRDPRKVNKITMNIATPPYGSTQVFTAEGMEGDIWSHVHRFKIERLLSRCSADQLRQIAAIVGYNPASDPGGDTQ